MFDLFNLITGIFLQSLLVVEVGWSRRCCKKYMLFIVAVAFVNSRVSHTKMERIKQNCG